MDYIEMIIDKELCNSFITLCKAANSFGSLAKDKLLDKMALSAVYATVLHDLFHPEDKDFTHADDEIIEIIAGLLESGKI